MAGACCWRRRSIAIIFTRIRILRTFRLHFDIVDNDIRIARITLNLDRCSGRDIYRHNYLLIMTGPAARVGECYIRLLLPIYIQAEMTARFLARVTYN
ncbi:hypothetical protein D3C84_1043100 [compost metagenome]